MKISSQQKGSGKFGNAVYAQYAGTCVAREKAASVANPSTEGQVTQRSKFKLMSQLSAAMAPAIAIRKEGMKSARNIFSSINMPFTTESEGVAQINLNKVQLTKSNLGLAEFTADRSSNTKIAVALAESVATGIDSVVYVAFKKQADGSLMQFASVVVSVAGEPAQFAGELPYTADSVVIYAYGMRANSDKAKAAYANMQVPTAEQVAKLIASSSEIAGDTTLTKTKALTMNVGETSGASDDEEHFLVSVSASGNGSVSGGGSFTAGQICTLQATPDAEASFVAWKRGSASGATLSTNANYSFEVTEAITIVGVFQGGPTPHYNINASVDPANAGSVSGTGSKEEGTTCTLTFTPAAGSLLAFDGWYENDVKVSSANPYSFTVEQARTLVAKAVEPALDGFRNVTKDGNAWLANQSTETFTDVAIAGQVESGVGATKIAMVKTSTKPSVNSVVTPDWNGDITSNAFSGTFQSQSAGVFWLVACSYNSSTQEYTAKAVYPYNLDVQGF